jgi:hypothetical protein
MEKSSKHHFNYHKLKKLCDTELNITINAMSVVGTSEMAVKNDMDISEWCYLISDCFRVFVKELG